MTSQQVVDFTDKLRERDEFRDMDLHRIYFYDAEPIGVKKLKPLTGGRQNGQMFDFKTTPTYQANIQLLDDLKRKPFYAVRLGEVNFRGWLVKPQKLDPKRTATNAQISESDLIPNVQQKGVDMRIGLDIASISLKDHADIIALVTVDSDFIPALKFARREGKQIFLYTLGHGVRPEIFAHSGLIIEALASDV